jgi:hypothetical protein
VTNEQQNAWKEASLSQFSSVSFLVLDIYTPEKGNKINLEVTIVAVAVAVAVFTLKKDKKPSNLVVYKCHFFC